MCGETTTNSNPTRRDVCISSVNAANKWLTRQHSLQLARGWHGNEPLPAASQQRCVPVGTPEASRRRFRLTTPSSSACLFAMSGSLYGWIQSVNFSRGQGQKWRCTALSCARASCPSTSSTTLNVPSCPRYTVKKITVLVQREEATSWSPASVRCGELP